MRKNAVGVMAVLVLLAASFLALAKSVSGAAEAENSWVSKASMKTGRAYLGVATVDDKIYAIGGDKGHLMGNLWPPNVMTREVTNANEEYDLNLDMWVSKASMPTARARFGIAVFQNKIYCIGGYSGGLIGSGSNVASKYYNLGVNEVYDPSSNTWEVKEPLPTRRAAPATNMVDGKIYVIGGFSIVTHSVLNVVEVYDPETDTWETKTLPPLEVGSSASAVVDNKIYVLGEDPDEGGRWVLVFDPATDSWSVKARASANIGGSAAATTGVNAFKRVYFFDSALTTVYDPANDSWSVGASVPTPRPVAGAVAVDELIYVIGGRTGQSGYITDMKASTVNEQYTPFGYGAPDPSIDKTAPKIVVSSPENKTYYNVNLTLSFAVNETTPRISYSLDGLDNVTVAGNATLSGLPIGVHNVTVYAWDAAGNGGASETLTFTVAEPEPFPVAPVAVASAVSVAVVSVALLVYFKKRKR